MTSLPPYKRLFSKSVNLSLKAAASILADYPESAHSFAKIAKNQKTAEKKRKGLAEEGIEVPPLIIVSATDSCNLACSGCYSCLNAKKVCADAELNSERIAEILAEAFELGVAVVMLAGGEPLLNHDWLHALGTHKEMVGIVFTNGTLLGEQQREWFGHHRHVIPTISIEGNKAQTDARRGEGIYDMATKAMADLRVNKIPFGISVTMTAQNIDNILLDSFVEDYLQKGCHLFIFVEYVPVKQGTEPMVLSKDEKTRLKAFSRTCAEKYPALFVPFPGDEEPFDGCLAAGRGFVHISASGDVEPCPFAPFSDVNLAEMSLKEALASTFLAKIREKHHLLKEGEGNGGCALWHNREWLQEI
jgi:MoaA/NifB/PqqE/SkfB family radical SAM enzyme